MQCFIPNFMHLNEMVMEQSFFLYFPMNFFFKLRTFLSWGHFGSHGTWIGPQGIPNFKQLYLEQFMTIRFAGNFYFLTRSPCCRAVLDPEAVI